MWGCEGTNTNISIWSIGTVKMKECHINFTIIKFDTIRDSFTSSSKQNNIATSHGRKKFTLDQDLQLSGLRHFYVINVPCYILIILKIITCHLITDPPLDDHAEMNGLHSI